MAEESVKSREERAKSSTSPAELEKLAEDESFFVRWAVALNENPPALALEKLAEDKKDVVRIAVAENANTPVSLLEKLAEDKDCKSSVAGNPSTPVPVLEKLAEDEDEGVRMMVILNANTPVSLLEKLAEDENWDVRIAVAENTSTPSSLLEKFAEDEDEDIREAVANNANMPASMLEKLAEDESKWVRNKVARNASTPIPVLEKLAEDQYYVREGVAANANTPASMLEKLAEDENEDVRKAVATNANTPVSALEKGKAEEDVRKRRKKMSEKILIKIKSRLIAGWIAEFSGDECEKIKAYCNDEANNEDIRSFFGGPQQEKLVQNLLEDEDWDMYEWSLRMEDFAIGGYFPLTNSEYSDATIKVILDGNVITDGWKEITIIKEVLKTSEWKKMYRENEAIAYCYGYISDDEHNSVFSFDEISDFDVSNLSLIVVENEFYEYEYVQNIQYMKNDGEIIYADFEGEDFTGDYFNTLYFET